MSEKKIDEISSMFVKTSKPKLNIDKIDRLKKISVIYDATEQGKNALLVASRLAKSFNLPLKIIAADDYYEAFKLLAQSTNEQLNHMIEFAEEFAKENEVPSNIVTLMGTRVEKLLQIYEDVTPKEEKLSSIIVDYLTKELFDIVVIGAPLFKKETEESYFGFYLIKILRETNIHSNILVVSNKIESLSDILLSFVSVDQQPASILALIRRSLSLSHEETSIKLIGMVEDKIIETVARVEIEDDSEEDLQLIEVGARLKHKMQDTLSSISIADDIEYKSFDFTVETGVTTSIVKQALENHKPGLVLVRSVSRLDENLDPTAEHNALTILQSGYPVLLVWD